MAGIMGNSHSFDLLHNTGLRLLSIDCDVTRTELTLHVLKHLMRLLNDRRREAGLASVKPSEVFDLIGGVGFGGLVAIMLGRLEMDVDEYISTFAILGIKPLIPLPGLRSRTSTEIQNYGLAIFKASFEGVLDLSGSFNDAKPRKCRTFVYFSTNDTSGLQKLRSYNLPGGTGVSITVKEVVVKITTDYNILPDHSGRNRLVHEAASIVESEAVNIWGRLAMDNVKCLISVGIEGDTGTNTHGWEVATDDFIPKSILNGQSIEDTMDGGRNMAQSYQPRWLSKRYFRFNIEYRLQSLSMRDFHQRLEQLTAKYFGLLANSAEIAECVSSLETERGTNGTASFSDALLHAMERLLQQQSIAAQQTIPHTLPAKRKTFLRIRPCYLIALFLSLVITGSATFALYWTITTGQMGDGFTAASWFVAVGTLIIAVPLARHYAHCTCWKKVQRPDTQGNLSDENVELGHLARA